PVSQGVLLRRSASLSVEPALWAGVLKGNGYGPARDAKSAHDDLTRRGVTAPARQSTSVGHPASAAFVARSGMSPPGLEDRAMAKIRLVASRPLGRANLPLVEAVVATMRPTDPLLCLRPAAIAGAARRFIDRFPGDVLYAVKCNPEPRVLRALWAGGIRHFDCASLPEIALVRKLLPQAEVHFMHPVKARHAIHAAFHEHGIVDFAFDSAEELEK